LFWSGFGVISLGFFPLYFYQRFKHSVNKSVTITSAIITFVCLCLLLELMNMRNSHQYTHGITLINQQLEMGAKAAAENEVLIPIGELADQANVVNTSSNELVQYIEDLKSTLKSRTQDISMERAAEASLMDLSRRNDHTPSTSLLLEGGKAKELAVQIELFESTISTVFPDNQREAIIRMLDFQTRMEFDDHYERQASWAEYYFRDISLIGVISNLSGIQLKVRNAQNLALTHLKTQSEAQQPPSAEF
jgi:hypothetical protein